MLPSTRTITICSGYNVCSGDFSNVLQHVECTKLYSWLSLLFLVAVGRHGPEVSGLVGKDWTSQINPLYLAWNPDHLKTKTVHIEVAKFDWDSLKLLEETIVVKENVDNFGFHTVKDLVETATPK